MSLYKIALIKGEHHDPKRTHNGRQNKVQARWERHMLHLQNLTKKTIRQEGVWESTPERDINKYF